jgi:uncharacterized protein (TIGR03086 family)
VTDRDLIGIFLTLLQEFGARVHAVSPTQWSDPTPNSAWDVGELVAHLVTEHRWVEPLLRGLSLEDAATEVDLDRSQLERGDVGETYMQVWDDVAAEAAEAFSAEGVFDRKVSLARGETTVTSYIRELIFDLAVHSWDLGRAIGYPGDLPADVIQVVWEESNHFGDLSASDMYDRPVVVPADAPVLDRLIAMTGRDPY